MKPNPQQERLANLPIGNVLVVAPAGCGKTEALAARAKAVVARGDVTAPCKVLALTFSNKAKENLATRVRRVVGAGASQRITVTNFHGLAARVVRAHGTVLGIPADVTFPEDPWRKCKLAREEIRLPVFLELDQIDALFASIKDADVELLVRLCIFTGRRIGEVVALEWQKLDLDGLKYQAWSPKTRRWQTYPMHAALADALRPVRQDIGYVVPRWRSANTAGRAVKNALRAAGFGNLRPHDLRHTFAFQLAKATNADAYELERRLGHRSGRYISRYTNPPEAVAAGYVEDL